MFCECCPLEFPCRTGKDLTSFVVLSQYFQILGVDEVITVHVHQVRTCPNNWARDRFVIRGNAAVALVSRRWPIRKAEAELGRDDVISTSGREHKADVIRTRSYRPKLDIWSSTLAALPWCTRRCPSHTWPSALSHPFSGVPGCEIRIRNYDPYIRWLLGQLFHHSNCETNFIKGVNAKSSRSFIIGCCRYWWLGTPCHNDVHHT